MYLPKSSFDVIKKKKVFKFYFERQVKANNERKRKFNLYKTEDKQK